MSHSTQAALLRGVLENPADDTVRLVYADYLDENGEPDRAEFVRLQIELAKPQPGCEMWMYSCAETLGAHFRIAEEGCPSCKRDARDRLRAGALLATNYKDWAPTRASVFVNVDTVPAEISCGVRFSRGWIDKVWYRPEKFVSHHPVTEVGLVGRTPRCWGGPLWAWYGTDHELGMWYVGDHIPECLYAALDQTEQSHTNWPRTVFYTSSEAALAALSRACVRYGRTLNSLPEIFPV